MIKQRPGGNRGINGLTVKRTGCAPPVFKFAAGWRSIRETRGGECFDLPNRSLLNLTFA